jgi:hypothetical protein
MKRYFTPLLLSLLLSLYLSSISHLSLITDHLFYSLPFKILQAGEVKVLGSDDFTDTFLKTKPNFIVIPSMSTSSILPHIIFFLFFFHNKAQKKEVKQIQEFVGGIADVLYGTAKPEQLEANPENGMNT